MTKIQVVALIWVLLGFISSLHVFTHCDNNPEVNSIKDVKIWHICVSILTSFFGLIMTFASAVVFVCELDLTLFLKFMNIKIFKKK